MSETKTLRGINLAAGKVVACRADTKQAKLVDLLARPEGATFEELHAAMNSAQFKHLQPWAEVTTRSALGWDVHKTKGYGIKTEFQTIGKLRDAGRRIRGAKDGQVAVYFLVLPKGMRVPLPHLARAADREKEKPVVKKTVTRKAA